MPAILGKFVMLYFMFIRTQTKQPQGMGMIPSISIQDVQQISMTALYLQQCSESQLTVF